MAELEQLALGQGLLRDCHTASTNIKIQSDALIFFGFSGFCSAKASRLRAGLLRSPRPARDVRRW